MVSVFRTFVLPSVEQDPNLSLSSFAELGVCSMRRMFVLKEARLRHLPEHTRALPFSLRRHRGHVVHVLLSLFSCFLVQIFARRANSPHNDHRIVATSPCRIEDHKEQAGACVDVFFSGVGDDPYPERTTQRLLKREHQQFYHKATTLR